MIRRIFLISFSIFFSSLVFSEGKLPKTIKICDDGGEWPPFSYYERNGGKLSKKIIGFSVDVINKIFVENNLKYDLELIPWKRCFNGVKRGSPYLMFLSGGWNKERERDLYISEPYYSMHPHLFYSKVAFPETPSIDNTEQLKKYKLCGLRGFNYSVFNIKDNEINSNFGSHEQLFRVVAKGRCQFSINRFEIIKGMERIGRLALTSNIKSTPMKSFSNEPFHMMFTKNDQGKELKKIIDQGILKLKKEGKLEKMLAPYLN